jgi:hypothetical protein
MGIFMRAKFLLLSLLLLPSCSSLKTIGFAAGGASAGALLGPGGAAAGAAVGVASAELLEKDGVEKELQEARTAIPKSTGEAFIDSTADLLHTVGWWYLIIFILVPLLTKKGRSWLSNLVTLHNTATKKDVDEYSTRLNKLEGMISSLQDIKK